MAIDNETFDSLQELIGQIASSSRVVDRKDALDTLKHFLGLSSTNLSELKDKHWQAIYEKLFDMVEKDKASFQRAKTAAHQSTAEGKLGSYAVAIRHVTEVAVSRIGIRTAKGILDQLVHFMTVTTDGFFEPLASGFFHSMKVIFEYQPHVEHIRGDWSKYLEFCLSALESAQGSSQERESLVLSLRSTGRSSARSTFIANGEKPGTARARDDDLVACIRLLYQAPNALTGQEIPRTLHTLLQYSRVTTSHSGAHRDVIATVNLIIARTIQTSVSATIEIIKKVIPIANQLWVYKTTQLKQEILMFLILTRLHVAQEILQGADDEFKSDLDLFARTLYDDYSQRRGNDQLHLDDVLLDFHSRAPHQHLPGAIGFDIKPAHDDAENHWTLAYFIGFYTSMLDKSRLASETRSSLPDSRHHKRLRITTHLDEFLQVNSSSTSQCRISTLQILSLMVTTRALSSEVLEKVMMFAVDWSAGSNPTISSWAFLLLVNCSFQTSSTASNLSSVWLQVWQVASGAVSSLRTSRAACHLLRVLLDLELVPFSSISQSLDNMLQLLEITGPAVLAESSVSFWITLVRRKMLQNSNMMNGLSEKLVRWLFTKWTPSAFEDRLHSSELASNVDSFYLLRFVAFCTGHEFDCEMENLITFPRGPVVQTWLRQLEVQELAEYLLLFQDPTEHLRPHKTLSSKTGETSLCPRTDRYIDALVLDFCVAETTRCLEKFKELTKERLQGVTAVILRLLTNQCLTIDRICSCCLDPDRSRLNELLSLAKELSTRLVSFIVRPEVEPAKVDAVLLCISSMLPQSQLMLCSNGTTRLDVTKYQFTMMLSRAFQGKNSGALENGSKESLDLMDVDDGFESQASQHNTATTRMSSQRDHVATMYDVSSFRCSIKTYLLLAVSTLQNDQEMAMTGNGAKLINCLLELSPEELCLSWHSVLLLLQSPVGFNEQDLLDILQCVTECFFGDYDFERHETGLSACLDVLALSAEQWTSNEDSELSGMAIRMYELFVNKYMPANLVSCYVKTKIAALAFKILQVQGPDWKTPQTAAMSKTIIGLLAQVPLTQHYAAQRITELFNHFTLDRHEEVFDTIFKGLPLEKDEKVEQNAMRLYIFSRLAASWPTLQRRGLYHIFETAGKLETQAKFAAFCGKQIAHHLSLHDEMELFRLFAPQILYTWLSDAPVDDIPFSMFKYGSLNDLLKDVEDEVVAQAFMSSSDNNFTKLSQHLGAPVASLAAAAFARAAAYCFAKDSAEANLAGQKARAREARLKHTIGEKEYVKLLDIHCPQILAILFSTVNIHTEKTLIRVMAGEKKVDLTYALKALEEMNRLSASTLVLPPEQQPAFSGVSLVGDLLRLSRRTGRTFDSFWKPPLFVYVLRTLLQKLHKSLGSLHACIFLRKIRILIAISGPSVYSGYPLEMALHALRPLLTDQHCATDAIGITQYLLQSGLPYLTVSLPFVSGFLLSTLVSMRKFALSKQDSTTQESDHQATLSKAREFREWLVRDWRKDYESRICRQEDLSPYLSSFKALMDAVVGAQSDANASKGTPESQLLKQLLSRDDLNHFLLSDPVQQLSLSLFCEKFDPPTSFRDDLLGSETESAKYATTVLRSCQNLTSIPDSYVTWAGRILGRAHNSSEWSYKAKSKLNEVAALDDGWEDRDGDDAARGSKVVILQVLCRLLISPNRNDVGLAEDALRDLISKPASIKGLEMEIPGQLIGALRMEAPAPTVALSEMPNKPLHVALTPHTTNAEEWVRTLAISLVKSTKGTFLRALARPLFGIHGLATELLAPIIHLMLFEDFLFKGPSNRTILSQAISKIFVSVTPETIPHTKSLIEVVLYLRQRPHPEATPGNPLEVWLNLNLTETARAAEICGLFTSALLFAETATAVTGQSTSQRRSTSQNRSDLAPIALPNDLLLNIYSSIDEPDAFYGVHQSNSLASVVQRLDYEKNGYQALLFHSARLDSDIRLQPATTQDTSGIIQALSRLNLNSVSHALLSSYRANGQGSNVLDDALQTARKLEQWDIRAPETSTSEPAMLFKVFQGLSATTEAPVVKSRIDSSIVSVMRAALKPGLDPRVLQASFRTLGVLAEIDEVISSRSVADLVEARNRMIERDSLMSTAQSESFSALQSSRETLFNVLSGNPGLQALLHVPQTDARSHQVHSLLHSTRLSMKRNVNNGLLASANYLTDLVPICKEAGIDVELDVQEVVADILWSQGEQTTSVHMLEALISQKGPKSDSKLSCKKATILAKLGHHIGEARLENSAQITEKYMTPALEGLKKNFRGEQAGRVLHEFAAFCDRQLHNPDVMEESKRITEAKEKRKKEVEAYRNMIKASKDKNEHAKLNKEAKLAQRWYGLDREESDRMTAARDTLIKQCIENYLRSLAAWDQNDNDVLRFFSIWLEYSNLQSTNDIVAEHVLHVPSHKLAVLMNQLSSLLQEDKSDFQKTLKNLIYGICLKHPYHSLHHIFATLNNTHQTDASGASRKNATKTIADAMKTKSGAKDLWNRFWQANTMYHALATYTGSKLSVGKEVDINRISPSATMAGKIQNLRVPPATMDIPLNKEADYTNVPITIGFKPKMTIASGISAPKILTAIASNGQNYKQLYKAGNDDLRQDAIMEQVFEQVSQLLKNHPATRQRKMHIRTYKVLPLSGNSGIIEFVPNTIPLSDYLQPAHVKYRPSDWSWNRCREKLQSIMQQTNDQSSKVKVFREVMANFQPIMRFFFLERFVDPDTWFEKRLAYTRSTAAISMLGHILGLGDRHCHNILLDQATGEAVHIDLGIAFEAGRVLPVPEVVPFRLSRDIVDGFGITKTEGVFRRCCEFTLDALREDRESIMTLLNVLRFDPLVNWTVNPLRAKRLQSEESGMGDILGSGAKDDGGMAERALSVVEKKLSKVMSTAATVSELIQQATDEKNLAVLYPGWSPWA
ncbi:hypothetical protein BT63DRAFT_427633 [Microthyrium microscopicum]|uniref:Serine/threonine-protein kinase Tel1 n=1 Tax=Microthyrium microscopicum TaxID=703497 RepID=A0A6A6U4M3_9PEZI|nr:hypothetical protein BT63DRAFT_427633 [Microthyrium microscopicum]